ncbi:MAG: dipeptidase [Cytophagales bacterium]|nr:dipeptidase [Cytophagales bacterium]
MHATEYLKTHQSRQLEELFELLRIPSVSTDSKFADDVNKAADFVKDRLLDAGVENVQLFSDGRYPIVYGEKTIDPSLPTVLVYGHYDVQPADPYELWDTPPFEPTIKDDKIYARGACDDKGQMYMHVKAIEALIQTDSLPCNVKFLIEGEEESGSGYLNDFVKEQEELLKADVILISDTSMISNDTPSLTTGIRGMSYIEIEVTGPNRDLHSGTYGGAVANPINELAKLIADMKDEYGRITIPGFYDDVVELTDEERADLGDRPFDLEAYKAALDIGEEAGETGYTTIERTGVRPTLDVNGIWGGYIGEGAKTVLPSKAYAKLSTRLVPNQNSDKITQLLEAYLTKAAPKSVSIKVTPHHGGEPVVTSTTSIAYQAASAAFEEVWGKKPIPTREGGSIPIVALFKNELGIDSILMGFGLDSDAIHSPNEHYGLFNFYKGIETITQFYGHFLELSQKS